MTKTEALDQVDNLLDQSTAALAIGDLAKAEFLHASTEMAEAHARVLERLRSGTMPSDRFLESVKRMRKALEPLSLQVAKTSEQIRLAIPESPAPAVRLDPELLERIETLNEQLEALAKELDLGSLDISSAQEPSS